MQMNTKKVVEPVFTHEGGKAKSVSSLLELRRSVLSTMLWENDFYESGQTIVERIKSLIPKIKPTKVAELAIEARTKGKLRHVPLLIVREMARLETHKDLVAYTLSQIIQRPDELTEFLAIYFKDGKQSLSAQVKKGLARAFTKFDEYSLAKYNRSDVAIKLRDVLFLCHAKPKDDAQAALWKRLVNNELATPDTWEVSLSASKGANKKEAWERLLAEAKLGGLALLRNLRNFKENGVNENLVRSALKSMKTERVLPYRFVTAAKYAPNLEPELEEAMYRAIDNRGQKINGKTVLLIDVSGSMKHQISGKSDSTRFDAATGLAILARELFNDVEVYTFSDNLVQVPTRRGFALRDAILTSQRHANTYLGKAIKALNDKVNYNRLIIFTDEQSGDAIGNPQKGSNAYVINVAANKNGVGYGAWNHIDGFSESALDYIIELEQLIEE